MAKDVLNRRIESRRCPTHSSFTRSEFLQWNARRNLDLADDLSIAYRRRNLSYKLLSQETSVISDNCCLRSTRSLPSRYLLKDNQIHFTHFAIQSARRNVRASRSTLMSISEMFYDIIRRCCTV